MKNLLTILPVIVLLSACASIHPGKMGKLEGIEQEPRVIASAQKQSGGSDDYHTFISFTVENKTDQIVRVLETEINFDSAVEKKANILVGADLATWIESFKEEQERKRHNRKIGQLAMIIGGAVLGIAGKVTDNAALSVMGAGGIAGGAIWSVSDKISDSKNGAQSAKKVPDTHIYAPFSVPAGKYIRRWLVVHTPKDSDIKNVVLKMSFEGRTEKTYVFDL